MTVFVQHRADFVLLLARAEDPDGLIGDMHVEVRPGQTAFGQTYDWWRARSGAVEIDPDGTATTKPETFA
jgi:hypothetical protein